MLFVPVFSDQYQHIWPAVIRDGTILSKSSAHSSRATNKVSQVFVHFVRQTEQTFNFIFGIVFSAFRTYLSYAYQKQRKHPKLSTYIVIVVRTSNSPKKTPKSQIMFTVQAHFSFLHCTAPISLLMMGLRIT